MNKTKIEEYVPTVLMVFFLIIILGTFTITLYHDIQSSKKEEKELSKYDQEQIIIHRDGAWRVYRLKRSKVDTSVIWEGLK